MANFFCRKINQNETDGKQASRSPECHYSYSGFCLMSIHWPQQTLDDRLRSKIRDHYTDIVIRELDDVEVKIVFKPKKGSKEVR